VDARDTRGMTNSMAVMLCQRVRPEVAGPMTGSSRASSKHHRLGMNATLGAYWIIRMRG
jgi:hypothetical protein